MSFYKFERQDIFHNRIKLYPKVHFMIKGEDIFYNKQNLEIRQGTETIQHTPQGHLNLYEMNINREEGVDNEGLIYPYVTKSGTLNAFSTVSTESFQAFPYGDEIKGSYPLSSSISIDFYLSSNTIRRRIKSLRNTFNYYRSLSEHYAYENSEWNKEQQDLKLISIPSIFYGSSIRKGSVKMNLYVSGSLMGTLEDTRRNGELVQTFPEDGNKGKVAGVVLYNEGFVSVTGSWAIDDTFEDKYLGSISDSPRWVYWGQRQSNPATIESEAAVQEQVYQPPSSGSGGGFVQQPTLNGSSWDIEFDGESYVSTVTMLAHAKIGELNHSNNPTFVDYPDREVALTQESQSPYKYQEKPSRNYANVVRSYYPNTLEPYEKVTYISKIGIYDEHKNLIAIAKLATPVKKTESRSYTFKMKLDI